MKLRGYEDLRVQKTISSIYTAFEDLICQMDYEKIRVTELAKRAQINPKTFYRYYSSLDDLLAEMQARYSEEFLDLIADLQYPRDLTEAQRIFFTYSAKQSEAYEKITVSQGSYDGIRQQMIDTVMQKTWEKSEEITNFSPFQIKLITHYIQEIGLSFYRQWIQSGKEVPIEEVIETANLLTSKGVEGLLKRNQ